MDPPELFLSGPEDRLAPLQDRANAGKRFAIEGWFYLTDRHPYAELVK